MDADEIKDRRAVVAPAAEGVGPAVVAALVAAGFRVAADRSAVPGAVELGEASPAAFLDAAEAALGPLDLLVVSARPVRSKPVLDIGADEFREVIEADLVAPALLMQEAGRRMAARSFGRIVVFASMSGKTGVHHNVGPFAAAKGGLLAFVRVMASELAEHGVTVNGIATALFEPQVATMTEEKRAGLLKGIPVGRFGRSEEAAHAVLYLASRRSGFVTGECLNLSGGRFMD